METDSNVTGRDVAFIGGGRDDTTDWYIGEPH